MDDAVASALRRAQIDECVFLEGEGGQRVALGARVDPQAGRLVWSAYEELPCYLRTKQWMYPMLQDAPRNEFYRSGIRAALKSASERCDENEALSVLDIGSGTGLLAMLAAREAADLGRRASVVGCEMQACMAQLAARVVADNGLSETVRVLPTSLQELQSADVAAAGAGGDDAQTAGKGAGEGAQVVTSELLDWSVLGEGWLSTLHDAFSRGLIRDGASIVPLGATVWAQVVSCPAVGHASGAALGSVSVPLSSDGKTVHFRTQREVAAGAGAGARRTSIPLHAALVRQAPGAASAEEATLRPLTPRVRAAEIDASSFTALRGAASGKHHRSTISACQSGVAHAVLYWFELHSAEGCTYDSSAGPFQDHWPSALAVLPPPHLRVTEGEAISVMASYDLSSIDFQVERAATAEAREEDPPRPLRSAPPAYDLGELFSTERFIRLARPTYTQALSGALESLLAAEPLRSLAAVHVLDTGNFSLAALLCAKADERVRALSIENDEIVAPFSARFVQLGNDIADPQRLGVLVANAEGLSAEALGFGGSQRADFLVFEPYVRASEHWPVRAALQLWYHARCCYRSGLLAPNVVCSPRRARIRFAAVELLEGADRAYAPLGGDVAGFDHRCVDAAAGKASPGGARRVSEEARATGTAELYPHPVSVSLGQWPFKALTEHGSVGGGELRFSGGGFDDPVGYSSRELGIARVTARGTVHAIVAWVDYDLGDARGSVLSSSPREWWNRQELHLLREPVHVESGHYLRCVAAVGENHEGMDEDYILSATRFEQLDPALMLMEHAAEGRASAVDGILSSNAALACRQEAPHGQSPLMLAAAGGNVAVVDRLLRAGAPWNAVDAAGRCAGQYCKAGTPVFRAILDFAVRAQLLLAATSGALSNEEGAAETRRGAEARPSPTPSGAAAAPRAPSALGQSSAAKDYAIDTSKPEYLLKEVSYTSTKRALVDADGDAVMMQWEAPLMERHARQLCTSAEPGRRSVLNVGFGMGIIDTYLQGHQPREHTIVEAHPGVLRRMRDDGWYEKAGVTVVEGRWEDALADGRLRGPFDGIFFDTYGEAEGDVEAFFDAVPGLLARSADAVFSFFNGFAPDNAFFHRVAALSLKRRLAGHGMAVAFRRWPIEVEEEEWRGIRRRYWHDSKEYYAPHATWTEGALRDGADPRAKKARGPQEEEGWPFA